jgi:hypothetical protein
VTLLRKPLADPTVAGPQLARRALLATPFGLGLGWLTGVGSACAATLPAPASLASELAAALQASQPLVVMASLDGCPFCRIVRDTQLAPLQRQGLPVVQLDMGSAQPVRGFDGTASTHERLLREWKVGVAPTVLFFGRDGREVADRLAGASIPDFYGAYLDERLRIARLSLR